MSLKSYDSTMNPKYAPTGFRAKSHRYIQYDPYGKTDLLHRKTGDETTVKREKKAPMVGIKFEMMNINDAMPMLVSDRVNTGRFAELKEGILEQVMNARKNQTIVFSPPTEDTRELISIKQAIVSALKKAGENWTVRYSQKHKKFIVVHIGRLNWKGRHHVSKAS